MWFTISLPAILLLSTYLANADTVPTITVHDAGETASGSAGPAFITAVSTVAGGDQAMITGAAASASATYFLEGEVLQAVQSALVIDCQDEKICVQVVANQLIKPPAITDQSVGRPRLQRRLVKQLLASVAILVAGWLWRTYLDRGIPNTKGLGVPVDKGSDRQASAVKSGTTFAVAGPTGIQHYSLSDGLIAVPKTSNTFSARPEPTLLYNKDEKAIQIGFTGAMKDAYTDTAAFPKECFKTCGNSDVVCLAKCANEWNLNIFKDAGPGGKNEPLVQDLAKVEKNPALAQQWDDIATNLDYLASNAMSISAVLWLTGRIRLAYMISIHTISILTFLIVMNMKPEQNDLSGPLFKLINKAAEGLMDISSGQFQSLTGVPRAALEEFPTKPEGVKGKYPAAIDYTHPYEITFEYQTRSVTFPKLLYNIKLDGKDVTPGQDGSLRGGWYEFKRRWVEIPVQPGKMEISWHYSDKLDLSVRWEGQNGDLNRFRVTEDGLKDFWPPQATLESLKPTQKGMELARKLTFTNQPRPRNNMFRLEFNHTIYTAKDDSREPYVEYKLSTSALVKTQARNQTINQGKMEFGSHGRFDIKQPTDLGDWQYPIRVPKNGVVVRVTKENLNSQSKSNFIIAHDGTQYAVSHSNPKKSDKFYCDQEMVKTWFDCPSREKDCKQRFFWCYIADPLLDCSKVNPKLTDCDSKDCEKYPMAERCWKKTGEAPP